jgi:hypothetical protein
MKDAIKAADDESVADRDQADAAARDARRSMDQTYADLRAIGVDAQQVELPWDAKALAWRLAVAGAITRRIPRDQQCEHAQPGAGRPLVASLTSRWMTCRECAPRLVPRLALTGDDDHCDVCDRQATKFSEFSGVIGPLHLTGNICGVCRFWFEGLQRSGSR